MKKYNLSFLGRKHEVYPVIHEYSQNGNLAIQLMTEEEGFPEPWSFLTVNLGVTCPENCAFVDINNNGEEILDFIINNNIGKPTGRCKTSGFVTYPEYKFTNKFLNKGEIIMNENKKIAEMARIEIEEDAAIEEAQKAEMAKKVEKDRLEAIKQFGNNDLKIVIGEHKILIAKGLITMFGITETHPNFDYIIDYVCKNCNKIKDENLWYDVYEGNNISIRISNEWVSAAVGYDKIFAISKNDASFNDIIDTIKNYCQKMDYIENPKEEIYK